MRREGGSGDACHYELGMSTVRSGRYTVHVCVLGSHIVGSPVSFDVSPGAPSPYKCELRMMDLREPAFVNQRCEVLLITRDRYDNQLDRGGVRVDAKAMGIATSACCVEDRKDGTYIISLTAGVPGEVRVQTRVDSVELRPLPVFFLLPDADGDM